MDLKELKVSSEDSIKKNHPWEYARSKVVCRLLKKYLKKDAENYVLDVGCGDAFFLTRFADRYPDFKLIAVDTAFDPELISIIAAKNSKYNIQFFNHIQHVTNLREATVVFLLDVLEHIEDDICFLKELTSQAYISPDTLFVITVPAFQKLFCRHDLWLGHYRRYSEALFKQRIEAAGLSALEEGYFFTSLPFLRYIQKSFEKSTNTHNKQNQGIGNYNGGVVMSFFYEQFLMLDFYFFRFFRLLGIRTPGLSTYAICKKTN